MSTASPEPGHQVGKERQPQHRPPLSACRGCRSPGRLTIPEPWPCTGHTAPCSSARPRGPCPGPQASHSCGSRTRRGEGRDALASQPHLVIWVDRCAGLARLHLDEAQRWLLALPVCGVY
jgi:hypothetical protein